MDVKFDQYGIVTLSSPDGSSVSGATVNVFLGQEQAWYIPITAPLDANIYLMGKNNAHPFVFVEADPLNAVCPPGNVNAVCPTNLGC